MRLEEFNALPEEAAQALVRTCADVPWWAQEVVAARPYGSVEDLRAHAREQAAAWGGTDVAQALADHPRIGERHPGAGASAALSTREQAGVDPADADVATRLAAGNRAYEEKFGRVFLVRAAGRSSDEILALLEQRLTHDPRTEVEVTAQQLREIAELRLAGLVT
ncbi:2-oxo-4-hydroxy-4-carboxy-5-ureidoimidazoline decarboxylase [Cellulomonas oligotrophica]|uniref:2-oxo-4-hydroxy-4-carboxy-5-ureidoimidazoline decarboxylase n=1 Tax=Cellulomonas oligotrophica TaxID=931536 RepID=A0A7Y9FE23_9CELL|nr:2-oxo-4-hydroxy-4-carboxy-5-ureidoimidazoline decarboxylase [Cellulomonas oligotrophica]NYD85646.1 2-oxo-4-hydroxy-4-carboxy-5-ureidoimidazoline decarboxylase [Cellulomonas oligotrophica]GIG31346.1 OHCU decarboxylase [Cellulomonas oligotrophica]